MIASMPFSSMPAATVGWTNTGLLTLLLAASVRTQSQLAMATPAAGAPYHTACIERLIFYDADADNALGIITTPGMVINVSTPAWSVGLAIGIELRPGFLAERVRSSLYDASDLNGALVELDVTVEAFAPWVYPGNSAYMNGGKRWRSPVLLPGAWPGCMHNAHL